MPDLDLRADCARCASLCCVAFHFDRSDQFAFDKRAGEPCAHLGDGVGKDGESGCRIHARRAEEGFGGCVGYDCHGAGPWVTQGLFGGRSWRRDPALLAPMAAAFLAVERAHRLLAVLAEAEKLDLSAADRRRLDGLIAALRQASVRAGPVVALEAEAGAFLRGLRGYVSADRRLDRRQGVLTAQGAGKSARP